MVNWSKVARFIPPLLAIVLILAGFQSLSGGFSEIVGGLIYIITGAFYFRPVRAILSIVISKYSIDVELDKMRRGFVITILVLGMIAGVSLMPNQSSQSPSEASTNPTIAPTTTEAAQTTASTNVATTATTEPTTESTTRPTTQDTSDWSLSEGVTVTVVSVTDGDTLDVRLPNGTVETIRLLGVDTPETSVTQVTPDEWEDIPDTTNGRDWLANWGGRATSYAEKRLSGEIYIQTDPESDRRGYYGRLLAYAYQSESSDTSFNHRLLSNGYARYYSSEFSKQTEFQSAESLAQGSDTGVWGYTAPEPTSTETQPNSGSGNLVVADVHADADGNDHENLDDEYIVLKNNGGSALDIGGWTISDEADHTYTIPTGFTLDAGASVTVYTGSGSNSDSALYWSSGSAVWNNGGDTIIVTTDGGETVIDYEY